MLVSEEKGDAGTGKCVLEMGPVGCPGRGYAGRFYSSRSEAGGSYNRAHMETTSASYRYIVRSPDVRGGHARVEGTRIGVHDVIGLIVNGASVDEVCRSLPDLKRSHVYECLAYYEDHRAEIDDLVAVQMHDPNA